MITITRRIEFDAAHRVLGHEGKCKLLHGHRYLCEVTVEASELDPLGRVVDFGVVKEKVGGWVDRHWDHNVLLHAQDPLRNLPAAIPEQMPYIMSYGNPTAENIAATLYGVAVSLLPTHLKVVNVRVYETPNCYADYRP